LLHNINRELWVYPLIDIRSKQPQSIKLWISPHKMFLKVMHNIGSLKFQIDKEVVEDFKLNVLVIDLNEKGDIITKLKA
jgi:hypothetical protein